MIVMFEGNRELDDYNVWRIERIMFEGGIVFIII